MQNLDHCRMGYCNGVHCVSSIGRQPGNQICSSLCSLLYNAPEKHIESRSLQHCYLCICGGPNCNNLSLLLQDISNHKTPQQECDTIVTTQKQHFSTEHLKPRAQNQYFAFRCGNSLRVLLDSAVDTGLIVPLSTRDKSTQECHLTYKFLGVFLLYDQPFHIRWYEQVIPK